MKKLDRAFEWFLLIFGVACCSYCIWLGVSGLIEGQVQSFSKRGNSVAVSRTEHPLLYTLFVFVWLGGGIWLMRIFISSFREARARERNTL